MPQGLDVLHALFPIPFRLCCYTYHFKCIDDNGNILSQIENEPALEARFVLALSSILK